MISKVMETGFKMFDPKQHSAIYFASGTHGMSFSKTGFLDLMQHVESSLQPNHKFRAKPLDLWTDAFLLSETPEAKTVIGKKRPLRRQKGIFKHIGIVCVLKCVWMNLGVVSTQNHFQGKNNPDCNKPLSTFFYGGKVCVRIQHVGWQEEVDWLILIQIQRF